MGSESGDNSANGSRRRRRSRGRSGGGSGDRRRGGRPRRSSGAYKKRIEERLFGKKGEAGRTRMIERLRQSQGTPNFGRYYRELVKGHGMPDDIPTLMVCLDVDEDREALRVVDALEAAAEGAPSELVSLLKSRLRNLEMEASSDAVADAAAALLERL